MQVFRWPCWLLTIIGVAPSWFFASTFAPASQSRATLRKEPARAAAYSGVAPGLCLDHRLLDFGASLEHQLRALWMIAQTAHQEWRPAQAPEAPISAPASMSNLAKSIFATCTAHVQRRLFVLPTSYIGIGMSGKKQAYTLFMVLNYRHHQRRRRNRTSDDVVHNVTISSS